MAFPNMMLEIIRRVTWMTERDEIYKVIKDLFSESDAPSGLDWEDIEEIIDTLRLHMYDEDRTEVRKKINETLDSAADKAYIEKEE